MIDRRAPKTNPFSPFSLQPGLAGHHAVRLHLRALDHWFAHVCDDGCRRPDDDGRRVGEPASMFLAVAPPRHRVCLLRLCQQLNRRPAVLEREFLGRHSRSAVGPGNHVGQLADRGYGDRRLDVAGHSGHARGDSLCYRLRGQHGEWPDVQFGGLWRRDGLRRGSRDERVDFGPNRRHDLHLLHLRLQLQWTSVFDRFGFGHRAHGAAERAYGDELDVTGLGRALALGLRVRVPGQPRCDGLHAALRACQRDDARLLEHERRRG